MTVNEPEKPPFRWWPPNRVLMEGVRDVCLFMIGAAGLFHETAIAQSSDPQLLAIFAACLGLPFIIRKNGS